MFKKLSSRQISNFSQFIKIWREWRIRIKKLFKNISGCHWQLIQTRLNECFYGRVGLMLANKLRHQHKSQMTKGRSKIRQNWNFMTRADRGWEKSWCDWDCHQVKDYDRCLRPPLLRARSDQNYRWTSKTFREMTFKSPASNSYTCHITMPNLRIGKAAKLTT